MEDTLDEFTCHVCFELYKEPITLPCSHTFCHVCIEKCWESRRKGTDCVCPNCHEVFQEKPKFKKNIIIANFVEKLKLKKREVGFGVGVQDAEHGGVKSGGTTSHCELCHESAAKRCVPCEILCCEQHLKPHQQKGHRLIDPGENIEELRCINHRKPILLFCKDDGSLMCSKCTVGQHQDHIVLPVEVAHAELKGVLAAKCSHVSESMQSLESQLLQVQDEKKQTEQSGRDAEDKLEEKRREVCQLVNEYVDLMKSQINNRKMEKLSLLEKQREKLEQQMEALRQGKSAMETALQDLEAISFLQSSKDLLKRIKTMSDFNSMKATPLTVLDFSKEENNLDALIKLNKNVLENIQKGLEEHPAMVELDPNNLRSLFGRNLNLDQNSANPWIMISKDLRTATLTETKQPYQEHPDRFDCYPQVVSSESFSSGRHYWEVDASLSRLCRIGISLNPMGRKGREKECGLGRNPQSWCLWKYNNKYTALHNNEEIPLPMSGDPKRFGFFLDCEAGELMCFGDSRVLHVFRGNFTDPVKPAIGVYDVHNSVGFCSF